MGAKSYVEALLEDGSRNNTIQERRDPEDGWQLVVNRKAKNIVNRANSSIFVAKIPLDTKAKEIWEWIGIKEGILDIILPRKRDKLNNMIGFIKTATEEIAKMIIERLRNKPLKNSHPDLRIAKDRNLNHRRSQSRVNPRFGKQNGDGVENLKKVNTSEDNGFKNDRVLKEKDWEIKSDKVGKDSEKSSLNDNHDLEEHLELIPLNKGYFENCFIGFTCYPMQGDILKEVIDCNNLGISEIKELSCWKYLLVFSSKEKLDVFNWSLVKDWLTRTRAPDSEDLLIKRKAVIEIRGGPLELLGGR